MSSEASWSERESAGDSSELERLLPLLAGADPAEAARVEALLVLASPAERALAAAYEADEAALAAFATTQRGDHPVLAGFADAVMARVSAAPEEELAAPGRAPAPVLRPVFGVQLWIGLAAAALLAFGVALSLGERPEGHAPLQGGGVPDVAVAAGETELGPEAPLAPGPLVAPARPGLREVARPSGRRGIVPVDGRGGRSQQQRQVFQELLRMQGWGMPSRVPPLREGEREVDF